MNHGGPGARQCPRLPPPPPSSPEASPKARSRPACPRRSLPAARWAGISRPLSRRLGPRAGARRPQALVVPTGSAVPARGAMPGSD